MALQTFSRFEGLAAALWRENVDTDVIIPSREITGPGRDGYGPKAFAPWRYVAPGGPENPDFVLNRPPWRDATMLIAGANFGCGSSREMAVWALAQFGFRVLIAPSFGAIFRNNCVRNGVLAIELPLNVVQGLAVAAQAAPLRLTVDLVQCRIEAEGGTAIAFTIDEADREMLLTGLDAIDRTLQQRDAIAAFEARDRHLRPWVWIKPAA